MRAVLLLAAIVGALAGPALEFDHAGSSCKMSFSGTELDTDCSLSKGFKHGTSLATPPTKVSELEFAYADNTCSMFFDGKDVTTNCKLGEGFTDEKPASFDGTGAKIVFDDKGGQKCEFSYDGTTLDTDCVLGKGFQDTSVSYVKVWRATGWPGRCGWSTSPTYCTLGKPDRITTCWRNGVVGYCKKGSNCGGFFTKAQMDSGNGQKMGHCTIDHKAKSCSSNDCVPDSP